MVQTVRGSVESASKEMYVTRSLDNVLIGANPDGKQSFVTYVSDHVLEFGVYSFFKSSIHEIL